MNLAPGSRSEQYRDENLYSVFGLLSVLGGVVTAIVVMPDDPQPKGAMFWPALCLAVGIVAVPIMRARASLRTAFRGEHVLMFALVYWLLLDMLQSAYPLYGVSYDSVSTAIIAIGTIAIGIWIGTLGKGWRLPELVTRIARLSITDSTLFMATLVTFCLGMFYFAFSSGFDLSVMIDGLRSVRFGAPWDRGATGDWRALIEHMTYFGYVLPSLTVSLANQKGWLQTRVVVSAALSLIMILFLMQSNGRRVIGVVIGAALINWMLLQKRLRPKLVIGSVITLMMLLVLMQQIVQYRKIGFDAWLRGEAPRETFSHLHIDDNFLRLSQITGLFPEITPYIGLQPLEYVLVRPIPRVFWPDKPVDPGYNLSRLVNLSGSAGTTLSHSIIGELYVMYGLLPVLLGGLFFGRLAQMWNKVIDGPICNGKTLVYGLGIMILFVSVRSMQDFVIMSYGLLGWLVIARIINRRKRRGRTVPVQAYAALPPGRPDS